MSCWAYPTGGADGKALGARLGNLKVHAHNSRQRRAHPQPRIIRERWLLLRRGNRHRARHHGARDGAEMLRGGAAEVHREATIEKRSWSTGKEGDHAPKGEFLCTKGNLPKFVGE